MVLRAKRRVNKVGCFLFHCDWWHMRWNVCAVCVCLGLQPRVLEQRELSQQDMIGSSDSNGWRDTFLGSLPSLSSSCKERNRLQTCSVLKCMRKLQLLGVDKYIYTSNIKTEQIVLLCSDVFELLLSRSTDLLAGCLYRIMVITVVSLKLNHMTLHGSGKFNIDSCFSLQQLCSSR